MLLYSAICRVLSTQFPGPGFLQIKQNMIFRYPTFADAEISIRLETTDIQPTHQLTEIHTVITLSDGKTACEGSALVHMPGWKGGFPGIDDSIGAAMPSEAQTLKHLEIGQAADVKRAFTTDDLAEYADLTGDTNPLFQDRNFSQQLGFKDRLIPGPLLSGMFSNLLGTQLPGRGTNWLKQSLHFPAPAYVDDSITARVEIIRLRPAKDLINLRGTCTNSSGELVCQAQSLVLVRDLEL
jgi:acyl dehydratase